MPLDWTATTFGVLVAIIGALFTGFFLLARRELDHHRDRATRLEDRLGIVEADHVFLKPMADRLKRKMEEEAVRMAEAKGP